MGKKSHLDLEPPGEIVLKTLRASRKVYLLEYACGLVLAFLLLGSYFKGIKLWAPIPYFVAGLALYSFASAEASRILITYKVTPTKMVIIKGLLKQTRTSVYFHPLGFVPNINIGQSRMQRILNYGTIYIAGDHNNLTFEVKDINEPRKIMLFLEDLIEQNRRRQTASKR